MSLLLVDLEFSESPNFISLNCVSLEFVPAKNVTLRYGHTYTCIYTDVHMQHKHVVSELQRLRVEREQLLQQNHDYQAKVKVTEEEMRDLSSEVELLKGKLKEAQTVAG